MLLVNKYLLTLHCLAASIILIENVIVGIKKLAIIGQPVVPRAQRAMEKCIRRLGARAGDQITNVAPCAAAENAKPRGIDAGAAPRAVVTACPESNGYRVWVSFGTHLIALLFHQRTQTAVLVQMRVFGASSFGTAAR